MRPVYKYTGLAVSALALFILTLLLLFSSSHVEKIVKGALYEQMGINFIARDFSRAFPLGFKAEGVKLLATEVNGVKGVKRSAVARVEIVEIDFLSVYLKVAPLLIGKQKLSYMARLENGELEGEVALNEKTEVTLRAKDIPLKAALELSSMGIGEGTVSGVASFTLLPGGCAEGSATLDATRIDIAGLNSPLPAMLLGKTITASLAIETTADCVVDIKGLFIKGHALNVRLKGTVKVKSPIERSALDMKIEIFIKPGKPGKEANQILLSTMDRYKRSSGYYLMSLKGTVGKPSIRR